jgi:GTPase SAR1 family protein
MGSKEDKKSSRTWSTPLSEFGDPFAELQRLKGRALEILEHGKTWVDEVSAVCPTGNAPVTLKENSSRLKHDQFNLVVVGEFSSGKSYFINVLLNKIDNTTTQSGKPKITGMLPDRLSPTTSTVTVIRHGSPDRVTVFFKTGKSQTVDLGGLEQYLAEAGHADRWIDRARALVTRQKPTSSIQRVEICCDAPWLANGISVVDTPGVGSVIQEHAEITSAYIPQADAIIFMFAAQPPINNEARLFLSQCSFHADRFFFVQTMKDREYEEVVPGEWRPRVENGKEAFSVATEQNTAILTETLGAQPRVFGISARWKAFLERGLPAPEAEMSGFPDLVSALEEFLAHSRGRLNVRHHVMTAANTLIGLNSRLEVLDAQVGKSVQEIDQQLSAQEPVIKDIEQHVDALKKLVDDDLEGAILSVTEHSKNVEAFICQKVAPRVRHMSVNDLREAGTVLPTYIQLALNEWVFDEATPRTRSVFGDLSRKLQDKSKALEQSVAMLATISGVTLRVESGLSPLMLFRVPVPDLDELTRLMGVSVGQALTKRVGRLTDFILRIPVLSFLAELLNKGRIDDARRDVENGLEEVLGKVAMSLVASYDEFYGSQAEVVRRNIHDATKGAVETYSGSLKQIRDQLAAKEENQRHLDCIADLQGRGRDLVSSCEMLLSELAGEKPDPQAGPALCPAGVL